MPVAVSMSAGPRARPFGDASLLRGNSSSEVGTRVNGTEAKNQSC